MINLENQVATDEKRPCKSLPEGVPTYCEVVKGQIVIALVDSENEQKACTAILDLETMKWKKAQRDQRTSPMQGTLLSFANQARLLYADNNNGQIFEFEDESKGWIKWDIKLPIPPHIRTSSLQMFSMEYEQFCPKNHHEQTKSLSIDPDLWEITT